MNFPKLIINAALTGIVPTRGLNPHVPLTPKEIATDARKVYDHGVSIVHVHARDNNGAPTPNKDIYREIIGRIRDQCPDVIVTVSTSGRRVKDVRERMEVLELGRDHRPDMASVTLGSMNFKEDYSVNSPETIATLLETMKKRGIKPELEIFDSGMAHYAAHLFHKGYLEGPHYCNLILGSLGTMAATPRNLVHLAEELPDSLVWAATGVGRFAFDVQCLSLAMGGHVRVGMEDSIYMDKEKREFATNEQLVLRVKRLAEAMGRETASPAEVRSFLHL